MNICFTSQRAFADGPVTQPFLESDPANIAYALGGTYTSFYSLRHLSAHKLQETLAPFDWVIVELNVEVIELVTRIIRICEGRVATYSEGHIGDYQRLPPAVQVRFVQALRSCAINFVYWEKYVPFYRALADRTAAYLPYPYLLSEALCLHTPLDQRPRLVAMPSGLAGSTRNGLATLLVVKRLLDSGLVDRVACWLEPDFFQEDSRSIRSILFSEPAPSPIALVRWREWLRKSPIDYRPLLRVKKRLGGRSPTPVPEEMVGQEISFFRRAGWLDYLARLSTARILVDMNNRETVGRNALDCAALGIPYVSTNRADLTAKIFPETTLDDPWDVSSANELCQRLLTDETFYHRVVLYARTAVEGFGVEAFRERFKIIAERSGIAVRESANGPEHVE